MAKEKGSKESAGERLSRIGRNYNAIGAVALAGVAAVIPGPNVVLASLAAINAAQAGGFEVLRSRAEKKRKKRAK